MEILDYTIDHVGFAKACRHRGIPLKPFQRMLLVLIDNGIEEEEAIRLAKLYASQ